MKKRYIFLNELLANYFLTKKQTNVTYQELTKWAEFLHTNLSTNDKTFITEFTTADIKSLRTSVLKYLFKFSKTGVTLKGDMDQLKTSVWNYTSAEIREGVLKVCDSFKTNAQTEELTR